MLLNEFLEEYNKDNGWFGPEEISNGALRIVRIRPKPFKDHRGRNSFTENRYFYLYICQTCGNNCLTTKLPHKWPHKKGLYVCSASSRCNRRFSKKNMGITKRGYKYYNVHKLDKKGNRIPYINNGKQRGWKKETRFEHRDNMEEYIDRPLITDDVVHHIDMNKLNNNIDNLWLCNTSTHELAHASFNMLCAKGMNKPIQFGFDTKKGIYYLKETI
tara:strand:- start:1396 stop:2043 length:648 start_codon:yes stop_codon:yes gene_type:complete